MKPDRTTDLMRLLQQTSLSGLDDYLRTHADPLTASDRPFTDYLRQLIRDKGLTQQEVFVRAGIPERYGYKLISQERRTAQRDYILRLCIAARLSVKETQRALKLYGMPALYPKVPRDAILIVAINSGLHDPEEADSLLRAHQLPPLRACSGDR